MVLAAQSVSVRFFCLSNKIVYLPFLYTFPINPKFGRYNSAMHACLSRTKINRKQKKAQYK